MSNSSNNEEMDISNSTGGSPPKSQPKRGRGRPRKTPKPTVSSPAAEPVVEMPSSKRGRKESSELLVQDESGQQIYPTKDNDFTVPSDSEEIEEGKKSGILDENLTNQINDLDVIEVIGLDL